MAAAVAEQAKLLEETFDVLTQKNNAKGSYDMGSIVKFLLFAYIFYS